MRNDLPSWVFEYNTEYNNFKTKKNIYLPVAFGLYLLCFIFLVLAESIEYLVNYQFLLLIPIVIGFFLFVASIDRSHNYNKHLGSMLYYIGSELKNNSDPQSSMYISNMGAHLKNCDKIIKAVTISLRGSIYAKYTLNYTKKLSILVELINEFYVNYPKYDADKIDIAQQIIELANLIHDDNRCITDKHIKLIDCLISDLTKHDVMRKKLYVSKTQKITSTCKTTYNDAPYNFKLLAYIAVIIFVAYHLINVVALSKGITQDTAFGFAIGGSIGLLVPALLIKDNIIK